MHAVILRAQFVPEYSVFRDSEFCFYTLGWTPCSGSLHRKPCTYTGLNRQINKETQYPVVSKYKAVPALDGTVTAVGTCRYRYIPT